MTRLLARHSSVELVCLDADAERAELAVAGMEGAPPARSTSPRRASLPSEEFLTDLASEGVRLTATLEENLSG